MNNNTPYQLFSAFDILLKVVVVAASSFAITHFLDDRFFQGQYHILFSVAPAVIFSLGVALFIYFTSERFTTMTGITTLILICLVAWVDFEGVDRFNEAIGNSKIVDIREDFKTQRDSLNKVIESIPKDVYLGKNSKGVKMYSYTDATQKRVDIILEEVQDLKKQEKESIKQQKSNTLASNQATKGVTAVLLLIEVLVTLAKVKDINKRENMVNGFTPEDAGTSQGFQGLIKSMKGNVSLNNSHDESLQVLAQHDREVIASYPLEVKEMMCRHEISQGVTAVNVLAKRCRLSVAQASKVLNEYQNNTNQKQEPTTIVGFQIKK